MSKVIPVLPAKNIKEQCAFYESIGFATVEKYTAPPYAVVEYEDITLHFWANKAQVPEENAICVLIMVEDADHVNELFTANLKQAAGRIPRSGFPRLSKVRALKEDRRFTLSDPSGNTLYFATPAASPAARALEHEKHAKVFGAAYDLLYSHENPEKAAKALEGLTRHQDELNESDRKKLDFLAKEIEKEDAAMSDSCIYKMIFSKIYPLYVQKAENKGRTRAEVDAIIFWLTGYDEQGLQEQMEKEVPVETFFAEAPKIHPNADQVKGVICGVRVEEIDDPLIQNVRRLDKLVDELAKGKAMDKILRCSENAE